MMTTVLIIESSSEFLNKFEQIISVSSEFSICKGAGDTKVGVDLIWESDADIFLIDLAFIDEKVCNLIEQACRNNPRKKFIVTVSTVNEAALIGCISSGVTGFLYKSCSPFELLNCLGLLRESSAWMNPGITGKIFSYLQRVREGLPRMPIEIGKNNKVSMRCTPTELEILKAFEKGESVKLIANIKQVSPNTVTHHAKNIFRKLDAHSRSEAVYKAKQIGII